MPTPGRPKGAGAEGTLHGASIRGVGARRHVPQDIASGLGFGSPCCGSCVGEEADGGGPETTLRRQAESKRSRRRAERRGARAGAPLCPRKHAPCTLGRGGSAMSGHANGQKINAMLRGRPREAPRKPDTSSTSESPQAATRSKLRAPLRPCGQRTRSRPQSVEGLRDLAKHPPSRSDWAEWLVGHDAAKGHGLPRRAPEGVRRSSPPRAHLPEKRGANWHAD